ncbi:MAG: DUF1573 domain-containing protein [Planctomycetota bacterium]
MNRLFVTIGLIVLCTVGCGDNEGAGRFACDMPNHDLGVLEVGARLDVRYKITNSGSSELKIDRTELTCGCSKARLSTKDLKPGTSTTLEVTLRLDLAPGPFKKSIILHAKSNAEPLVLSFEGTLREPYTLEPATVDFGNVEFGETVKRIVTVKPRREAPIKITNIPAGDDRVRGQLAGSSPGEAKIEISFRGDHRLGAFGSKLLLNSDPRHPYGDIQIPLVGVVRGIISVSRTHLPYDASVTTQDVELELSFQHRDGMAIEITSYSAGHRLLQVQIGKEKNGVIKASITGRVKTADLSGATMRVKTNIVVASEIRIPWIATP